MDAAWTTLRTATRPPPMIAARLGDAMHALTGAVKAHGAGGTGQAAIDVAQSVLDLTLAYRPPPRSTPAASGSGASSCASTLQPTISPE